MGDKNPIRTHGDYSKPSHEGYRNTIELPNDLRDFAKPVKAITLPQDVPSTSDRCLIELENQVQRLMEAHLAPTIAWKILNKPSMNSASSRTDEAENKEEEKVSPKNIDVDPSTPPDPSVSFITEKVLKLNSLGSFERSVLVPQSSSTKLVCTNRDNGDVMFIEIVKKYDDSHEEEPKAVEHEVEYFDIFLTRSELGYHKYLMCGPIPSIFLRNPIITEGCPSNLKIPCNIRHVHVEKAYIDPNSPLNIMTRMMYNWIMRRKLNPKENLNRGVSNFTGRINVMHVFVENFTYIVEFMIVEDISSIIDLEQYNSLSDLEKEHTKSVYLRKEEDKRRGVEYVMSKLLGFYKECLELGPEYVTRMDDEGEVTHSGKEKVTLDDLFLLHSMDRGVRVDVPWHVAKFFTNKAKGYKKKSLIVGAYLIGRIARLYGLMTLGSLRSVTLGPETPLLNVAKLVDLGICRYNVLGYGELVNDIPNNDEDDGAADAGDDDEGV
ncbi:hypothetical protein Tco_1370216 [Tanacetum coccineum]